MNSERPESATGVLVTQDEQMTTLIKWSNKQSRDTWSGMTSRGGGKRGTAMGNTLDCRGQVSLHSLELRETTKLTGKARKMETNTLEELHRQG